MFDSLSAEKRTCAIPVPVRAWEPSVPASGKQAGPLPHVRRLLCNICQEAALAGRAAEAQTEMGVEEQPELSSTVCAAAIIMSSHGFALPVASTLGRDAWVQAT